MGLYLLMDPPKQSSGIGYQVRIIKPDNKPGSYCAMIRDRLQYRLYEINEAPTGMIFMENRKKYVNHIKEYPSGFHILPTLKIAQKLLKTCEQKQRKMDSMLFSLKDKLVIVEVLYLNAHTMGKQQFFGFNNKVIVAKTVVILREIKS